MKEMLQYFEGVCRLVKSMQTDAVLLRHAASAATCIVDALHRGKKVLIAGNGGSAALAQHFACELMGTFKRKRRGLAVLALTTDSSFLTAWSNDASFETVFARQIEALGQTGDVFVGITTSGNSKNIIAAVAQARRQHLSTICLLGWDGGEIKGQAHYDVIVRAGTTQLVQDGHQWIIHGWCDVLDRAFAFGGGDE